MIRNRQVTWWHDDHLCCHKCNFLFKIPAAYLEWNLSWWKVIINMGSFSFSFFFFWDLIELRVNKLQMSEGNKMISEDTYQRSIMSIKKMNRIEAYSLKLILTSWTHCSYSKFEIVIKLILNNTYDVVDWFRLSLTSTYTRSTKWAWITYEH